MDVDVMVHLEEIPDDPGYSWWAESSAIPGFSAAAPSLPELLRRVTAAVPEILAQDPAEIHIRPTLVTDDESSAGDSPRQSESPDGYSVRRVAVLT